VTITTPKELGDLYLLDLLVRCVTLHAEEIVQFSVRHLDGWGSSTRNWILQKVPNETARNVE
jgi:hypothetical protein